MSRTAARSGHDIHSDTPLRLSHAVEIAFPTGGMTVSDLRREIARGRLEAELIAGKHFVTLDAIKDMRERCRVEAQGRAAILSGAAGVRLDSGGQIIWHFQGPQPHGPNHWPATPALNLLFCHCNIS